MDATYHYTSSMVSGTHRHSSIQWVIKQKQTKQTNNQTWEPPSLIQAAFNNKWTFSFLYFQINRKRFDSDKVAGNEGTDLGRDPGNKEQREKQTHFFLSIISLPDKKKEKQCTLVYMNQSYL